MFSLRPQKYGDEYEFDNLEQKDYKQWHITGGGSPISKINGWAYRKAFFNDD